MHNVDRVGYSARIDETPAAQADHGDPITSVLIVANQTIGGQDLAAAVTSRVRSGPCRFHLLVPVPLTPSSVIAAGLTAVESAASAIIELPDQRALAEQRLACGLTWLTGLGADASGEITESDAADAVATVTAGGGFAEVIVSTLPSRLSRWLRQDLPRKVERRVSIPVTVVTAAAADDADSGANSSA